MSEGPLGSTVRVIRVMLEMMKQYLRRKKVSGGVFSRGPVWGAHIHVFAKRISSASYILGHASSAGSFSTT